MDWGKYLNFDESEFACPCCKRAPMQQAFIERLQIARHIANFSFKINSGFRCNAHNQAIGGASNSAHLRGFAADIACTDSRKRWILIDALKLAGFNRIGISKTFIHADNDPELPSNVIWLY